MKQNSRPLMPPLQILRDIASDYPGLLNDTERFISQASTGLEATESFVQELRAYALKNFPLHRNAEEGAAAVGVLLDLFFHVASSSDRRVREASIDSLLFYLNRIITESPEGLQPFASILARSFRRLSLLPDDLFQLVVTHHCQARRFAEAVLAGKGEDFPVGELAELLSRYFSATYAFWLREEDPLVAFLRRTGPPLNGKAMTDLAGLFRPVTHETLERLNREVERITNSGKAAREVVGELAALPGHNQIVSVYEALPASLQANGAMRLALLLQNTATGGLAAIHEETLREISRTVCAEMEGLDAERARALLGEPLAAYGAMFKAFPETVLSCLRRIGREVYRKCDSDLVEWFLRAFISFGFQYPEISGLNSDWQVRHNRAHLSTIRTYLELIGHTPKWSKDLISALTISLRLGGVHIQDTDLFQKDISALLNSEIRPVYHFIKQLAKVFPVFFTEINAEGELREVSTAIDDAVRTADPLIHFLRKFCHVESSSLIVPFMEEALNFYRSCDKTPLERFLPPEIYAEIDPSGPFVKELHTIFGELFSGGGLRSVGDLLRLSRDGFEALATGVEAVSSRERTRAWLLIRFYQLLTDKYLVSAGNIAQALSRAVAIGLPPADNLAAVLASGTLLEKLEAILGYLELLQAIVLSSERFEAVEDFFRKRHIAAGIASVYGRYLEKKFNALALTFRLEHLANILFEDLVGSFSHTFITRATLLETERYARLFLRAFRLDGISSERIENTLDLLTAALGTISFTFTQYVDIFRGLSESIQDMVGTYCSGIHAAHLKPIIGRMGSDRILPKYGLSTDGSAEDFVDTVSERFLREEVAGSFGLQQFDSFISRVLKKLCEESEGLSPQLLDLLLSYDPEKALSDIHHPNPAANNRIHLGNKGYNLVRLATLGVPVPPGFVLTTETFRCLPAIEKLRYARDHLASSIDSALATIEACAGKTFGDPDNPLLVSVRSGAAVSMPGMMNSFLNVGLNEAIVRGLIKRTGKPWFGWDCYRRFLQCWGMFFGMERDAFDLVIDSYKREHDVARKLELTPEQMRTVALAYRAEIENRGIAVVDDPKEQLRTAIALVLRSWDSKKARLYRELLDISEHWGTAVIIQAMVYGNLDTDAGTGVIFTRNPGGSGDRVMLWGDYSMGAQGEDVVSGLVRTACISVEQQRIEGRTSDSTLERSFPRIYERLLSIAKILVYREGWAAQEIEFTFEGGQEDHLHILQSRDMDVAQSGRLPAFRPSGELTESHLATGIGVGGGALCGRAVFDEEDIRACRKETPQARLILIRSDTVPDDIGHIAATDGLLTARGGATSHAALVAKKMGKICVVGCDRLIVLEREKRCMVGGYWLRAGDYLGIDGKNGFIYRGIHEVEEMKSLQEES